MGIQFEIRPRITQDGKEGSLQVNADVSSVILNEDVNVYQGDYIIASSLVAIVVWAGQV